MKPQWLNECGEGKACADAAPLVDSEAETKAAAKWSCLVLFSLSLTRQQQDVKYSHTSCSILCQQTDESHHVFLMLLFLSFCGLMVSSFSATVSLLWLTSVSICCFSMRCFAFSKRISEGQKTEELTAPETRLSVGVTLLFASNRSCSRQAISLWQQQQQ